MISVNKISKAAVSHPGRKLSYLTLMLLLGCGSGGGANSSNAATTFGTLITEAPRVAATAPANSDSCALMDDSVSVTFSKPMNAGSISAALTLRTAAGTPVTGSVSYSGQTATFKPTAKLAANSTYTANIAASAQDTSGIGLSSAYTWSFKTMPAPTVVGNYVICWNPVNDARLMQYRIFWDTKPAIDVATASQAVATTNSYELPPATLGGLGSTVYIAVRAESSTAAETSALSNQQTVVIE